MTNLRKNIIEYRKTKDKQILENLYIYFSSYIKNICKKMYSEYKETDLIIKFIEIINKLNLKKCSNSELQGMIVISLIRERADIAKKKIKQDKNKPCYIEDLKIDIKTKKDDYLSVMIKSALNLISERERLILNLSFFEDKTDIKIGEILCISSARVGQIKKLTLNKLKKELIS